MKRTSAIAAVTAAALALSLAACGSADSAAASSAPAESTAASTEAASSEAAPSEAAPAGDFDADQDITVISREDGSGTRGAFIELTGVEEKNADGKKVDNTTEAAAIQSSTNGVPTLFKIGPLKFLLGTTWKPGNDIFGILPMILGSIYVTAGAILVGVPIGLLTAIYMSKFASPRINKVMLPAVQLLAGIPSVVYGFFGMIVLVPAVQAMVKSPFFKTVLHVKSGKGMSLFTAAVLLGIMILPTIITVSKTSLDAVPGSYYEGSLALGATHERSVFYAVLPAAKSGVLSAVILGIGRAIGETMAVVMVAGNQTWMPKGLFQGLRTMTSNIVIEMGYAADLHREALIATGVVLFVFILLINLCFSLVKGGKDYA